MPETPLPVQSRKTENHNTKRGRTAQTAKIILNVFDLHEYTNATTFRRMKVWLLKVNVMALKPLEKYLIRTKFLMIKI